LFITNILCLKLVEKPKKSADWPEIQSIWYFCMKFFKMIVFPKSKINLGLRITGKREDGYHNIETVFYPLNLCDALEIVENRGTGKDQLTVTGVNSSGITGENLVTRAIRLMREKHSVPPLRIHLHKAIPSGAGLGGGSSDAANTLKLVNRIFDLGISPEEMSEMALSLGSDCPFFIESVASYATGRGEILTPLDISPDGSYIVLLNKGITVSTREAYHSCIPCLAGENLPGILRKPVSEWRGLLVNDFERTVFRMYPEIESMRDELYSTGALYSAMSGSGSTVFGIYESRPELPEDIRESLIFEGDL
jgi:4-diphosphocytidyl-2-C-methyl-D-erythritol kinase